MTDHEIMLFIDAVNDGHERAFGTKPSVYGQILNLRENFGTRAVDDFEGRIPVLVRKGLVRIGPCGEQCHAAHLFVTGQGRELLELWNREGCQSHWKGRAGSGLARPRPRDCRKLVKKLGPLRKEQPGQGVIRLGQAEQERL